MKLIIEHLKKGFGSKEVLKDIDFEFEEGKIYGLLGRNGAGKTTFFNCLNEDIEVDDGTFYLEEKTTRPIVSEDIGYVLSTPNVPEFLTGREFLKFFIDINASRIEQPKSLDEYFDFMNIIANPKILLLDEPLTSFDVVVAEEMKQMLKGLKKGHIIIFSTHIMELALDLCDEIVILNKGVLEKIEKKNLDNEHFKNRIIEALKEE